jgi:hypothetical protein
LRVSIFIGNHHNSFASSWQYYLEAIQEYLRWERKCYLIFDPDNWWNDHILLEMKKPHLTKITCFEICFWQERRDDHDHIRYSIGYWAKENKEGNRSEGYYKD